VRRRGLLRAKRLEFVGSMDITNIAHSRGWALVVALAIFGLCISAWAVISEDSHEPFAFDELDGVLA
jgi:hypothetical protein